MLGPPCVLRACLATTAARRAAAFSECVWGGVGPWSLCSPWPCRGVQAGGQPHGACPWKCQAGWPRGAASLSAPSGTCLCLSGWSTCSRSRAGPRAEAGEAGPGEEARRRRRRCRTSRSSPAGAGVLRGERGRRRDPASPCPLQSAPRRRPCWATGWTATTGTRSPMST